MVDVNDNYPRFLQNYSININEDNKEEKLLTIEATDRDEGENAHLRYFIEQDPKKLGDQANIQILNSYFNLEAETGILKLLKPLDFESKKFTIPVCVKDSGQSPLSACTDITIHYTSPERFEPKFKVTGRINGNIEGVYSTYQMNVEENLEPGTILGDFIIVNPNIKEVDCLLEKKHADFLKLVFNLESAQSGQKSYIIKSGKPFDRELMGEYVAKISCTRTTNGKQSNPIEPYLKLIILDQPDEPPRFTQDLFEGEISENRPPNTFVISVLATAKDIDSNFNQMLFELIPNSDSESFIIDSKTGQIFSKEVFDREEKERYSFRVKVSDPTNSSISSSAQVIVKIAGKFNFSFFLLYLFSNVHGDLSFTFVFK